MFLKLEDTKTFQEHKENVQFVINADEIGDKFHYLMKCTNQTFTNLRVTFLEQFEQSSQLQYLNLECLFKYIITMSDMTIIRKCARYCFEILETYSVSQN